MSLKRNEKKKKDETRVNSGAKRYRCGWSNGDLVDGRYPTVHVLRTRCECPTEVFGHLPCTSEFAEM